MVGMDGLTTAAVAGGLVATAALPYAIVEARWRWRWREVEHGRIPADASAGPYRAAGDVPRYYERAPGLVRVVGFGCLLLGQFVVLAALIGMVFIFWAGVPVVAFPLAISAGKLYRAGIALLRREPRESCFRARSAVTWAVWANGAVVVFALVARLAWHPPTFAWLAPTIYSLVAIAHARLLHHVTRRYEDALFAGTDHP